MYGIFNRDSLVHEWPVLKSPLGVVATSDQNDATQPDSLKVLVDRGRGRWRTGEDASTDSTNRGTDQAVGDGAALLPACEQARGHDHQAGCR